MTETMKQLQKEDYTVGWICALPVPEWQASRLLFDVEHEDAAVDPNASYQYAFGEINGHNVVMGCLPHASPGIGSASSVATEMRVLFPSLRFGLLVGIGGGVPSKDNDIRLGDVVVGLPNKEQRHNGVVRYDYGKYTNHGDFEPMGMLSAPPLILQATLSKMISAPPTHSKFHEYLDSFEKHSDHASEFSSPPKLDQLFEASHVHPAREPTCSRCSSKHEVPRTPRPTQPGTRHPVKIFFGTIASGDKVVKDARKRDQINDDHAKGVFCIEMEAAGLMNYFPCLVIRGISDYCDSHKNKAWQPFASASAAAWAKELLRNVKPTEVAPRETISTISRQPISKPTMILPYKRDKHFVGRRKELEKLDSAIANTATQARIALVGLGGVGKSQIAIEYAHRLHQCQPGTSVFWIYAGSRERFRNDYQAIATEQQLPGFNDLKVDHMQMVLDWLRSPLSGRWLMILDNADDKGLTSSWQTPENDFSIPKYLPTKADSAIIVTSRDRHAAFNLVHHDDAIIRLEAMDEEEAVQLFKTKTKPRDWDYIQANRLAMQLDRIPLAITQAAAYIMARDRMTIAAYLEEFQDEGERLMSTSENDWRRDVNVPNSVIKTWHISFRQIQQIDPAAVELLFKMSFLHKVGIPLLLLKQEQQKLSDLNKTLETLTRFSFVESQSTQPEALKMHRLVQVACMTWMQESDDLAKWCYESLKLLYRSFPEGDFESWNTCQTLEPHAESVLEATFQHWPDASKAASRSILPQDASNILESPYTEPYSIEIGRLLRAELLYRRARYSHRQGRYMLAVELAKQAKADAELTLGPRDEFALGIASLLATSYLDSGDSDSALKLAAETANLQSQVIGDDHIDTISTLCTLAMAHRSLGSLAEAEEILLQSIYMHENAMVSDEGALDMATNDLALVYGDQGLWERKRDLQHTVLQRTLLKKGTYHPHTLSMQHNLAVSNLECGGFDEACKMLQRVVQAKKEHLGRQHPSTFVSMAHLAKAYRRLNRHVEAHELQRQIVEEGKAVLPNSHKELLVCMSDVALDFEMQRRLEESHELQSLALTLHRKHYGESNENTLMCMERLARLLKTKNQTSEARDMLRECLRSRLQLLGQDHPLVRENQDLLHEWTVTQHQHTGRLTATLSGTLEGNNVDCGMPEASELPHAFDYSAFEGHKSLIDPANLNDEAPVPDEFGFRLSIWSDKTRRVLAIGGTSGI